MNIKINYGETEQMIGGISTLDELEHALVNIKLKALAEKSVQVEEQIKLKALQNIPAFISTDMLEYGAFIKGQNFEISKKIAKLLIDRKLAEVIK